MINNFIKYLRNKLNWKNEKERVVRPKLRSPDRWLLLLIILLSAIGMLMIYDASVAVALRDFANPFYYVNEQIRWLLIGFLVLIIFTKLDYHLWYNLSPILLGAGLVLLMAVFIPGIGIKVLGARRWLNLGFFVLQPAEFAKLALLCYLSAWFTYPEKNRFGAFILLLSMVIGFVVLEPDLGTASIILVIALSLYFFSGGPLRYLWLALPLATVIVIGLMLVAPYRLERLTTYFNPEHDPLGSSYQIRQVLLALGSGGLTGVGVGKSRQKYEYLPEATTDTIFAIWGEETGLAGSSLVLFLFLVLVWRAFVIARRAPDRFGQLLALGIGVWVAVQTGINLSAISAIIPFTGVPLPLLSYGGSSLIILLSAMGILLNISRHRQS